MTTYVEEFVAKIGWEADPEGLSGFKKQLGGVVKGVGIAAAAVAGLATAVVAMTVSLSRDISIQAQEAKAVGLTAREYENWGFVLGAIGMDISKVGGLMKKLNQNIGGIKAGVKGSKKAEDAFKSLGLTLKEIEGMDASDQFKTILQASKDTKDTQTAQAAVAALLGADAVQMVGYLRDQNASVEDMLASQNRSNMMSEEARDGAIAFTAQMDTLGATTESVTNLFAGLLGEQLSPMVETLNEWVDANKEVIQANVKEWVDNIRTAIDVLITAVDKIKDAFTYLEENMWIVEIAAAAIISVLGFLAYTILPALIKKYAILGYTALVTNIAMLAIPMLVIAGIALLLFGLYKLWQSFEEGRNVFKELWDWIKGIWDKILGFFDGVWSSIKEFFAGLGASIKETFNKVLDSVSTFFSDALGKVWDFVVMLLLAPIRIQLFLLKLLIKAVIYIGKFFAKIWGKVTSFISGLWKKAQLGAAILRAKIISFVTDLWDSVLAFIKTGITKLQEFLLGIPERIKQAVSDAINYLKDIVKEIPLVGDLIEADGDVVVNHKLTGAGTQANMLAGGSSSSVNNTTNSTANDNRQNTTNINVTQAAGEDGAKFAERVASAVKHNDSGQDY